MDRATLRQVLTAHFNKDELRNLYFDLDVDYDALPDQGKDAKIRELIAYFEHRGRTAELVDRIRQVRSNVLGSELSPATSEDVPALRMTPSDERSSLFSNGYALLIGVGADLPITVQDANALQEVLTDPNRAAYPLEQVELLTEATANRQGVLSAFDRLIERVNNNPDATVVVYFSGHGGRIDRPGASSEYFLVPYGYDPSRRKITAISGLEFTNKIEAINSRKLVVFLDCCHAGGVPALKEPGVTFVKSPIPPDLLRMLESGSGRVAVASSHKEEYSYTGTPYSVFTTCLLEALEGKAAVNQDGYARILDILIYLFKHVPERAPGPQHPLVKKVLDLGDNFPLCYYGGGSKHITGKSLEPKPSTTRSDPTARQRHRLESQLDALQKEWDLLSEKVKRLRKAHAVEAGVMIKFQLEQQILETEARLAQLGDELDRIEHLLR